MPYKDDRDRCERHIQYLCGQLAQAKRAVKKIPKIEAEIAAWQARIGEGRQRSGRRVPKPIQHGQNKAAPVSEDGEPTLRRFQVWRY